MVEQDIGQAKLIGSFTKLIYKGPRMSVYNMKGKHRGLLQVGVSNDMNVLTNTHYELTVYLYGKQKRHSDGRMYHQNYMNLVSYKELDGIKGDGKDEEVIK